MKENHVDVWINFERQTLTIGDAHFSFDALGIQNCHNEGDFWKNDIDRCIKQNSCGEPVYYFE